MPSARNWFFWIISYRVLGLGDVRTRFCEELRSRPKGDKSELLKWNIFFAEPLVIPRIRRSGGWISWYVKYFFTQHLFSGDEKCADYPLPNFSVNCEIIFVRNILSCEARARAVGGGTGCREYPIPGTWLGFPARTNEAFHLSDVSELVAHLSGEDQILTYLSAGQHRCFYISIAFKFCLRHPVEEECVKHLWLDWLTS